MCKFWCTTLMSLSLISAQPRAMSQEVEESSDIRSQVAAEIARLKQSKQPSVSKGTLRQGILEHPAELRAPEGVGYYLAHPGRGTNYGNDRLVFGLMVLGVLLREELGDEPHHRLRIHDLSSKFGGKQERHINHQMGLDVDIPFFATDLDNKPMNTVWTSYGTDGKSTDKKRMFDVARNWLIIEGILRNEHFGNIRAILVADPLRQRLLTHAREKLAGISSQQESERKKLEVMIQQAEQLMRQPISSPHDNHFHLSLE